MKIVGVGAGLTYGSAGMTHHAIEDIAVTRALPNMTVLCPGDPVEAAAAIRASISLPGPCYLRYGKSGEKTIHTAPLHDFAVGKAIRIHAGKGLALIATGNMLETAAQVHRLLLADGLTPELVSMPTVKPIDCELIAELASRCQIIATIEEHSIIGGLGSAVGDILLERQLRVKLQRFALPDAYAHQAGSQQFLRHQNGLDPEQIARRLREGL